MVNRYVRETIVTCHLSVDSWLVWAFVKMLVSIYTYIPNVLFVEVYCWCLVIANIEVHEGRINHAEVTSIEVILIIKFPLIKVLKPKKHWAWCFSLVSRENLKSAAILSLIYILVHASIYIAILREWSLAK